MDQSTTETHETNWAGVVFVLGAMAITGFFTLMALFAWDDGDASVDDRPMPCAEDQVYVWDEYPTEAVCVSNTDHEEHAE
jgi:hypothetical protein